MVTKEEALKLARDYIYKVEYGPYNKTPVLVAIEAALDVPETNFGNIAQPAPIVSLECANCQLTIEQLNEKVMRLMAQPAQCVGCEGKPSNTNNPCVVCGEAQPAQEPVAWGFKNSAITGSNRWMMLRENVPLDDQYKGALWTPLYLTPSAAKPAQEPVAFKIYLPKAPRQDVVHGMLPWVYDQDPSSGNVASMWVTPVKHTPPQRPWVGLTDEERKEIMRYEKDFWGVSGWEWKCMEALEAKLKEKNT